MKNLPIRKVPNTLENVYYLQKEAHPIDFLKNLSSLLNLFQKSMSKTLGKGNYIQNSLKMIVYLNVEL